MTLKLSKPTEQRIVASIRRYCAENLEPVGELQAGLLLDFFLKEAGPAIYNQAVSDAQSVLQNHVVDLNAECFEPEVDYWRGKAKLGASSARPPK